MSTTAANLVDPALFAQALVDFSRDGIPPADPELAAARLTNPALHTALGQLAHARSELEEEVKSISRTSATDIDQWIQDARALRTEINNSRSLARSIINSATKTDWYQGNIKDQEARISFLEKEQIYNKQVGDALKGIKTVQSLLDEVEKVGAQNRILDALHVLSEAAHHKRNIPALATGRPLIMLEERYVSIEHALHEQFILQWKHLVNVDREAQSITIRPKSLAGGMDLDSVFKAMESFGEVEKLIRELAGDLKEVIFEPRFKLTRGELALFEFEEHSVRLSGKHSNCDVRHIIDDLEKLVTFLSSNLPSELQTYLSQSCSSCVSNHLRSTWLDKAVPERLGDDMDDFRRTMARLIVFAETLDKLGWAGSEDFREWVENCAKIWLVKRKEYCLDWVRNRLAFGIGTSKEVERVEKEVVKEDENTDVEDWDANWNDDENKTEEDADAWGADNWGFGDDVNDIPSEAPSSPQRQNDHQKQPEYTAKTVTLSELYTISSMPGPVFDTITAIIEDALQLIDPENESNPITPAAAGLFGIPTLVLAMYRAVAPYHYRSHGSGGGKMFQYNDALWLASEIEKATEDWKARSTASSRAHGKIKFDAEVEKIQRWGKLAYAEELNEQKTIVLDLMGGAQSFLSASSPESLNMSGGWGIDDFSGESEEGGVERMIDGVIAKIRDIASVWKKILSKSAWAQASGRLLSVVAKKIIADIQDRDSLSSDECELVARVIDMVLMLDDLFVPETMDVPSRTPLIKQPSETSTESGVMTPSSLPSLTSTTTFESTLSRALPAQKHSQTHQQTEQSKAIHQQIKEGKIIPLTSNYVEGWLRLQYLKEILESNLKDLVWLWKESELCLEWSADEVVELIEMCFVASDRRREAVGEIRGNPFPRG